MKFSYKMGLVFQNNRKDLDSSNKTDLVLWDCHEGEMPRLVAEYIRYTITLQISMGTGDGLCQWSTTMVPNLFGPVCVNALDPDTFVTIIP